MGMRPALVLAVALAALALPSAAVGDEYQMFVLGGGWHVVFWDVTKNEPATVTLWKAYSPTVTTQAVTVEQNGNQKQKLYHVITYELNGNYFQSSFAHDIVAQVEEKNGEVVPNLDSVDNVETTSQPQVTEVEKVLSPCGLALYWKEGVSQGTTSSQQSTKYLFLTTCDGWDDYFDGDLWPTRDINGDGKDEPTILWMPVGSTLVREMVPFLIQPKDSKNAVLLAERPFNFTFQANDKTTVDLSNWVSYVKLALPQVHAQDVYLLYVVCGPGKYQPKATIHVEYMNGDKTNVQFTLLDWCIMTVNAKDFVVDVNRGVGISFPDRISLLGKGCPTYVQPVWVQVYSIKVPVNPSEVLKDLYVTMDLSQLRDNLPYYIWMLALTIKRADGSYLLVMGPNDYVVVPPSDKVDLTVFLKNVVQSSDSMTFNMQFILKTYNQVFVNNLDNVKIEFYGNEYNESIGQYFPVKLQIVSPSGGKSILANKILNGLSDNYNPETGKATYTSPTVVVKVSKDELPVITDLELYSYEFREFKDNHGNLFPASIVVVPGLLMVFTSVPIQIQGAKADVVEYDEESGKLHLIVRLEVNFSTANSELIKVNRLLVKVQTPKSKLPLEIQPVTEENGSWKAVGQAGQGQVAVDAFSAAVASGSKEEVAGVYYFKSPIDVTLEITGPEDVIRKEGVTFNVALSGSFGLESNEYNVNIGTDVISKFPTIKGVIVNKSYSAKDNKTTLNVTIEVYEPSGVSFNIMKLTGSVGNNYVDAYSIDFALTRVSNINNDITEYEFIGTFDKGDIKMAVLHYEFSGTVNLGNRKTTKVILDGYFVWPADVYISNIKECNLVKISNYVTAMEVIAELTAYANGTVKVLFDGAPVQFWYKEENASQWNGPCWSQFQIQGINQLGASKKFLIKLYLPLQLLAMTENHVLEVDLTGAEVCGIKVTDSKAYCYWDVKVECPKLSPEEMWTDSMYGNVVLAQVLYEGDKFLMAVDTGEPLRVEASLKYETMEEGNTYVLQPATKEVTLEASEVLLVPPNREVDVERLGAYAVAQVPYEDLASWLKVSPAVPGFVLKEMGQQGDVMDLTFTPMFTTNSWESNGVCVNVYEVHPGNGEKGLLIDVWKVEIGNDKVTSVQHLARQVLKSCFAPEHVMGDILVYAREIKDENGESVTQECAVVNVKESDGKWDVQVEPLPGSESVVDANGDGKPDYVVHVWYQGGTVVFVTATADDSQRYGYWHKEFSGDVSSVNVLGSLVLVKLKDGSVKAFWIDERKGPELVTDYAQVGSEYVVSVGGGVFELQGQSVVSVVKPQVSGRDVFVFSDKVTVITDKDGKILAAGKPEYEDVKVHGLENGEALIVSGWAVVLKKVDGALDVVGGFQLPGKVLAVDVDHGVVVCETKEGAVPFLLTASGCEKAVVECSELKLFVWPVSGGALMVQLGGGGSIEKVLIVSVEGSPVKVQSVGSRWVLITKDEKGYHAYELAVVNGKIGSIVSVAWSGCMAGESVEILKNGDLLVIDEKEGTMKGIVQLPSPVAEVLSVRDDVVLYRAQNGNLVLVKVSLSRGTVVSVKVEVQSEGKELVVFEDGEFAVVDLKSGKILKTGVLKGLKRIVKAGTDYVLCELSSGDFVVVTVDGEVKGPALRGSSVDGAPVLVFDVEGSSLIVVNKGALVTQVAGKPLELEEGVLVTSAGNVGLISSKSVQVFTGAPKPVTCGPSGKPTSVSVGSSTVVSSQPPKWYPAPSVVRSGDVVAVCWLEKYKSENGYVVRPVVAVAKVSSGGLSDVAVLRGPEIHSGVCDWAVTPIQPLAKGEVDWIWVMPSSDVSAEVYLARLSEGKSGWELSLEPVPLYGVVPAMLEGGDGFPVCAAVTMGGDKVLIVFYRDGKVVARILEFVEDEKLGKRVWKWVPAASGPWELTLVKGVSSGVMLRAVEVEMGSGPAWVVSVYDAKNKVSELVVLRPSGNVVKMDGTVKTEGLAVVYSSKVPVPVVVCQGGEVKGYVLNVSVEKTKEGEVDKWSLSGGATLAKGLPSSFVAPGLTSGEYGYEVVVGGERPEVVVFEVQNGNVVKKFECPVGGHALYSVSAVGFGGWTLVAGSTEGGVEIAAVSVKPPARPKPQPAPTDTGGGGSNGPIVLPFPPLIRRRRGEARA